MGPNTELTVTAVLGAGLNHMTGITGLDRLDIGGVRYLYAASGADGGLTSWRLTDGVAVLVDQLGYTDQRGTRGVAGLTLAQIGGQDILLPAGRWDDRLAIHELGSDGGFDRVQILGADPDKIGGLAAMVAVRSGEKDWLLASQWGRAGLQVIEIRADLSVNPITPVTTSATADLTAIAALAGLTIGDRSYVFSASGDGDSVTSWTIGEFGYVQERATLGADSGLPIDAPDLLAAVHIHEKDFLIVGAPGTDSIDVLKVDAYGGLFAMGRQIDDRTTRFADIAALDLLETQGRHFVFAGGSDDGVSVFELTSQGAILHVATLAQPAGTTLANITAISADRVGDSVQIFVAGQDQAGVTQLALDVGNLGVPVYGTAQIDKLVGTGRDELLEGMGARDKIRGGRGDDRIVDGKGQDVLLGDAGADVFHFVVDRQMDIVQDFEPGVDKLDLSAFPMLYGMDQLGFVQKRYGVRIDYGDDRFRLELKEGQLMIDDLSPDDFLF